VKKTGVKETSVKEQTIEVNGGRVMS